MKNKQKPLTRACNQEPQGQGEAPPIDHAIDYAVDYAILSDTAGDRLDPLEQSELMPSESMPSESMPSKSMPSKSMFYYFAYGSCMCPVDLRRSLGEPTHHYVVGVARLYGYRLGFYYRSPHRGCGCLDIVEDTNAYVEGVLYCLPSRLSDRLDQREDVPSGGYKHELVTVKVGKNIYANVRTYSVVNKLTRELAPNDWYSSVVLRGASTCGLTDRYFWQLFYHIYQLQLLQFSA